MANQFINQTGYGLSQAIQNLAPVPVQAKRIPTANDIGYMPGQIWIDLLAPNAYILTQIAAGIATWQLVAPSGSGSFTTLTSTGATTLATTGASVNSFGNTTGATSLTLEAGTGGLFLDGATSTAIGIGASLITGTVTIGGTGLQTGSIIIGSGTGAQTIDLGTGGTGAKTIVIGGTAANVITIGNTQTAGSVAIGAAMTTGTITIGGTGLQTGTIGIGTGTGAQIINLGTGGTGAKTISVGGTAANVIAIGNTQTAGSIAMGAAMTTGTIEIGGTGLQTGTVSLAPGTGAQTVNIATGGTGVKTVNIATGAIGNIVTVGTVIGAASLDLFAGTGGVLIDATAGNVSVTPATVSAAAYAATLDARVGQVILTGQVLAMSATQQLTITNTVIASADTMVFVTVTNAGTNDAQLQVNRIEISSGGFVVTVTNVGSAALNGNIYVSFWVLN